MGVPFAWEKENAKNGSPRALQRHLSGNTYPRSVYVKEGTGRSILEVLIYKSHQENIHSIAGHKVLKLLRHGNKVIGAVLWKPQADSLLIVDARSVVVAMGGIGQLYAGSTYPVDVAADAFGLVYDAGACLLDMEFVQFEPVVTVWPEACRGMEMPTAMLGDGAQLLNAKGERFMMHCNPPLGERGIEKAKMSLFIQRELDEGRGFPEGGVLFDTTVLSAEALNGYVSHCKRLRAAGVDPAVQAPIVAPAAHSTMGGALIDENGWSGVPGLYVAGESAGGVHGASRIAGNGCTDTLVFGVVAGRGAVNGMHERKAGEILEAANEAIASLVGTRGNDDAIAHNVKEVIQNLISQSAGIWRADASLKEGLEGLDSLDSQLRAASTSSTAEIVKLIEAKHMATTARMILTAALLRTESRGAHQRTDFPRLDDDNWLCHIGFRKSDDGSMYNETIPIR
jgi:succinate dehydrogenase/fumarate reductase flavoprotein subunit